MTTPTSTGSASAAVKCPNCKALHFSYQLSCKRCNKYFHPEQVASGPSGHALAVAGGILAVSTVILAVCAVIHAF